VHLQLVRPVLVPKGIIPNLSRPNEEPLSIDFETVVVPAEML
jgi:hypothetical protein